MEIRKNFIVKAPIDTVWEILGNQYAEISRWTSGIQSSRPTDGRILKGAPCNGRVCSTDMGNFVEELVEYDSNTYSFAYEAQGEKMPFFVRLLKNHWKLVSESANRTRVEMHLKVTLMPIFSLIMPALMKKQMEPMLDSVIEELQHYAEKGLVHPRVGRVGVAA